MPRRLPAGLSQRKARRYTVPQEHPVPHEDTIPITPSAFALSGIDRLCAAYAAASFDVARTPGPPHLNIGQWQQAHDLALRDGLSRIRPHSEHMSSRISLIIFLSIGGCCCPLYGRRWPSWPQRHSTKIRIANRSVQDVHLFFVMFPAMNTAISLFLRNTAS